MAVPPRLSIGKFSDKTVLTSGAGIAGPTLAFWKKFERINRSEKIYRNFDKSGILLVTGQGPVAARGSAHVVGFAGMWKFAVLELFYIWDLFERIICMENSSGM